MHLTEIPVEVGKKTLLCPHKLESKLKEHHLTGERLLRSKVKTLGPNSLAQLSIRLQDNRHKREKIVNVELAQQEGADLFNKLSKINKMAQTQPELQVMTSYRKIFISLITGRAKFTKDPHNRLLKGHRHKFNILLHNKFIRNHKLFKSKELRHKPQRFF